MVSLDQCGVPLRTSAPVQGGLVQPGSLQASGEPPLTTPYGNPNKVIIIIICYYMSFSVYCFPSLLDSRQLDYAWDSRPWNLIDWARDSSVVRDSSVATPGGQIVHDERRAQGSLGRHLVAVVRAGWLLGQQRGLCVCVARGGCQGRLCVPVNKLLVLPGHSLLSLCTWWV